MADLSFTVSVSDFKDLFYRDFIFVSDWSASVTYGSASLVFYENAFYESLVINNLNNAPDVSPAAWKKIAFSEVKSFGYIADKDIEKSFVEAKTIFNERFFSEEASKRMGFLYLSAHYLVQDVNASGAFDAGSASIASSVSVGSVSESYSVPEYMTKDPIVSYLSKTSYGQKYLSMIASGLVGNFIHSVGKSTPF